MDLSNVWFYRSEAETRQKKKKKKKKQQKKKTNKTILWWKFTIFHTFQMFCADGQS